jgi:hypothetical protein
MICRCYILFHSPPCTRVLEEPATKAACVFEDVRYDKVRYIGATEATWYHKYARLGEISLRGIVF